MNPFLCAPGTRGNPRCLNLAIDPGLRCRFDLCQGIRFRRRSASRQTRLENPLIHGDLRRELGVSGEKVAAEEAQKIVRRDALECEMVEVCAEPSVEPFASKSLLEL